ncbi:MAG: L,D-transpeptidase family protein [Candidatus Schekmanbacteria bacterium]|nr:L,D-transpeptidase family protein [Candidatus Schekmanbacteria bacterium]
MMTPDVGIKANEPLQSPAPRWESGDAGELLQRLQRRRATGVLFLRWPAAAASTAAPVLRAEIVMRRGRVAGVSSSDAERGFLSALARRSHLRRLATKLSSLMPAAGESLAARLTASGTAGAAEVRRAVETSARDTLSFLLELPAARWRFVPGSVAMGRSWSVARCDLTRHLRAAEAAAATYRGRAGAPAAAAAATADAPKRGSGDRLSGSRWLRVAVVAAGLASSAAILPAVGAFFGSAGSPVSRLLQGVGSNELEKMSRVAVTQHDVELPPRFGGRTATEIAALQPPGDALAIADEKGQSALRPRFASVAAARTELDEMRAARAAIVRAGSVTPNIFVVDRNSAKLYHFRVHPVDRSVDVVRTFPVAFGMVDGSKREEGDLRTPTGVYLTHGLLQPPAIAAEYGFGAYPLDYPNPADTAAGRTGNGIWIHGTSDYTPGEAVRVTRGCITMDDRDLQALREPFLQTTAPVIILPSTARSEEPAAQEAEQMIADWAYFRQAQQLYSILGSSVTAADAAPGHRVSAQALGELRQRIESAWPVGRASDATILLAGDQLVAFVPAPEADGPPIAVYFHAATEDPESSRPSAWHWVGDTTLEAAAPDAAAVAPAPVPQADVLPVAAPRRAANGSGTIKLSHLSLAESGAGQTRVSFWLEREPYGEEPVSGWCRVFLRDASRARISVYPASAVAPAAGRGDPFKIRRFKALSFDAPAGQVGELWVEILGKDGAQIALHRLADLNASTARSDEAPQAAPDPASTAAAAGRS